MIEIVPEVMNTLVITIDRSLLGALDRNRI